MARNIPRGASAAVESKSGGNFERVHFLSQILKDGESVYLRFLTDYESADGQSGGVLPIYGHFNVPTLPAPAGFKGNWPQKMGAVCRVQQAYESIGGEEPPVYDSCYICDVIMPSNSNVSRRQRLWGLACLREEVLDENGKRIGFKDATRTVVTSKEGEPEESHEEKAIVVLQYARQNFWDQVGAYYAVYGGTILDRDYYIKREGDDLTTKYRVVPLDPIVVNGRTFDLRDDDLMARYLPEAATVGYAKASDDKLLPIIDDQSDDRYFGRFFDVSLRSAADGATATQAPTQAAAPVTYTPPVQASTQDPVAHADGLMERLRSSAPASDGAPAVSADQVPADAFA